MKPLIEVRVADEELEHLTQGEPANGPQLARLLDDELARFDAWMAKQLNGRLTRMESAIVKTYLYQKIVGRVDSLDTKPIDVLDMAVKTG